MPAPHLISKSADKNLLTFFHLCGIILLEKEKESANEMDNIVKECKNCQYCDLIENKCFLHLEADCCYKEGKCMVERCPAFKEGTWNVEK